MRRHEGIVAAVIAAVIFGAAALLVGLGWRDHGHSQPAPHLARSFALAPNVTVSPAGNDSTCARLGSPCASFDRAYQLANRGDVVQVAPGSYRGQTINHKPGTDGLNCDLADTSDCIHFVGQGVTITGAIDNYASDLWLDGGIPGPGWVVHGYVNTTSGDSGGPSPTTLPDHVLFQGMHSTNVNLSGASDVTYRYMDAGPATVTTGCNGVEGPINENKISINGVGPGPNGDGNGGTVPQRIVWDHIHFHDQNGDQGRIASDCHWGGLFIVNGNGVTISNSTFDHNVVYNVQIQNFAGPPVTNLTFDHDAFGCPVDWLYTFYGKCDGQDSIQFDGTFTGVTISNSAFAEGSTPPRAWGCYAGTCDYSADTFGPGNTFGPLSALPPPLPGGTTTTPTTTPTTTTPTTTTTTTATTTTMPATTPGVDVPTAKRELLLVLAWMHRTRTTGGLGYSVAQVRTTHAYRALAALGGAWNG